MVDYNENVYGRRGLDGRSHIPALPFWVALIRIAQFILALITLILAGYASGVFGAGYFPGYGMTFFTFAWTVLFLLYIFVTPLWFPQVYLYWAHLGFEIATVIFWLVTFALLAQEAAVWNAFSTADAELNTALSEAGSNAIVFPHWDQAIKATKAAAGIGALTWLLFIVTLVVFSFLLHKHRVANGSTGFGISRPAAAPTDVEAKPATTTEKIPTTTAEPPLELNDVNGAQHQVSSPAFA
ncbi:uncharacterized protein LY89DRAFT_735988 [Mollisia scopiformis]|uniref:MARVEL domain-containing protein n=1 Tax=Mollisia scopiformis TaxID=149040 RepID=A0A194X554_MOLSC|nr:uncharacterized protein LY89DRAFT_735988 [Mollisia scopiformis]KUJ14932.1 hypothetical protein LY89DRAFT_735988 [Mollisia scopiformis]